MAVVFDEVTVALEPGTTEAPPPSGSAPAPSPSAQSVQTVRAQLALIARRSARQRVD